MADPGYLPPVHETAITVRFDEVDSMGVVHHPRYLIYFEVARTHFMKDLGLSYREVGPGLHHLAVIDAGARYLRPALYQDQLRVVTRCTGLSGTRILLEYEVFRDAELLANGHSRLASVTPEGRPKRMPPEIRALFARAREEVEGAGRPTEA